jgi:hypothetical protein
MLNRHIIERHVGKSDFDLVTRMMSDWKDACSTITDSVSVMEKLDSEILKEGENIIVFDGIIGFGYNRWFERLYSNTMKVVVRDGEVVTAYLIISGRNPSSRYDFEGNKDAFRSLMDKNFHPALWDMFVSHIDAGNKARYIWQKKNPQMRVYTEEGTYKYGKSLVPVFVPSTI